MVMKGKLGPLWIPVVLRLSVQVGLGNLSKIMDCSNVHIPVVTCTTDVQTAECSKHLHRSFQARVSLPLSQC